MTQREVLIQRRNLYLKAERDVTLHGQTVEIEGMRITRASLIDLRKEIANLEAKIAAQDLQASAKTKSRIRMVIPA